MLKIYRTISPGAKFPFNVLKGSESQRFAKAKQMTDLMRKKMDIIDENIWSVDNLEKVLNNFTSEYDINYKIVPERDPYYGGSLSPNYEIKNTDVSKFFKEKFGVELPNKPIFKTPFIHINLDSFDIKMNLSNDNKLIEDKYAAIHEVRHFFDHLFNPKMSNYRSADIFKYTPPMKYIYSDEYKYILDKFMNPLEKKDSMKEFKREIEHHMRVFPIDLRITLLQCIRSHLKLENNAYIQQLKAYSLDAIKYFDLRGIIDMISFIRRDMRFNEKLKFVNKYLKECVEFERSNNKSRILSANKC